MLLDHVRIRSTSNPRKQESNYAKSEIGNQRSTPTAKRLLEGGFKELGRSLEGACEVLPSGISSFALMRFASKKRRTALSGMRTRPPHRTISNLPALTMREIVMVETPRRSAICCGE